MKGWSLLLWPLGIALGGLVAFNVSAQVSAPEPPSGMSSVHMWWYLGRAGGFVAYGLLFASVALGLAVSSRVFDGMLARPWVFEMHQFLSLFVLLAMLFHALVLLPDPYAQFTPEELLVPFASPYRPVPLAVGIIVLYGSIVVSASFYLKGLIGQRGWRVLHYGSFALFVGAMIHGILAGTDSGEQWAQLTYLSSGLAVLFLSFFRILASRRVSQGEKRAQAPTAEPTPAGR